MSTLPPAGPLVMVDIPGTELDPDTRAHLERHAIRAVCLFRKNVESEAQLARLCADLREVMGPRALIAVDQEGGAVFRTPFWPAPPAAMSLGAAQSPALAREVGAATARFLRAVGINWNFAPVLDLAVNPQNPVISERSFGDDPAQVIPLARAWLEGSLAEGVAACVKHFPGHGDTHQDSHLTLPRVGKDRAALQAGEFAPFLALKDAAPAVMTAHIVYDALDPDAPATLSPSVLTDLLRRDWQYPGVIITDSMGMRAIDDRYGRGEAAVQALRAGADMVMALGRREVQEATLAALSAALADGSLELERIEASLERLDALAQCFPAESKPQPDREADTQTLNDAWARGLTVLGGAKPPELGSKVLLIAQENVPGQQISEAGVGAASLEAALEGLYDLELCAYRDPAELAWDALRATGRTVLLATTTRQRQPALAGVRPDLHLALWNPYAALDVQAPALLTYGFREGALKALRAWLEGRLEAQGEWPYEGRRAEPTGERA